MRNNPEMLAAALRGYAGDVDDAEQFGRPEWLAHVAGAQMAQRGVTAPIRCAKGRGRTVNLETVAEFRFRCDFKTDYLIPSLERVS